MTVLSDLIRYLHMSFVYCLFYVRTSQFGKNLVKIRFRNQVSTQIICE